jgi:hypothetical protein
MDNPEKLATTGTQDTHTHNNIKLQEHQQSTNTKQTNKTQQKQQKTNKHTKKQINNQTKTRYAT